MLNGFEIAAILTGFLILRIALPAFIIFRIGSYLKKFQFT